jgi:hypothetical protein
LSEFFIQLKGGLSCSERIIFIGSVQQQSQKSTTLEIVKMVLTDVEVFISHPQKGERGCVLPEAWFV